MMKSSNSNPIDFDYQGIVDWSDNYIKDQKEWGGILQEASPVILTTIYAELVVEGSIVASKWNILAAKRHLNDLKRQDDPNYPWKFDEEKAWRPPGLLKASVNHLKVTLTNSYCNRGNISLSAVCSDG